MMGSHNGPMITQKKYSKEVYASKKAKTFGVAKRVLIMNEIASISVFHLFFSLGMFLFMVLGTSAIPYFFDVAIDFSPETFLFRGGFFSNMMSLFLIIWAISCLWYAIAYKRLEVMCIHLYGSLDGAVEVNEAAQRDHLANSFDKAAGLNPKHFGSIGGPAWVANNYLNKNGLKPINIMIFKGINVLLIVGQIVLALLCFGVLIK
jgi:hypothetical protein